MFKLKPTELESKKKIVLTKENKEIHIANYFLTYGNLPNKIKILKSVFLTVFEYYFLTLFIIQLEIFYYTQRRLFSFLKGFIYIYWAVKVWKRLIETETDYVLGIRVEKEVFYFYLSRS